jgi:peptidylprolyl isomerase
VIADEGDVNMSIEKPEVDFPGGEPPTKLQIPDIWEGDGAVAKAGDTVQVHYVGVAYSTGESSTRAGAAATRWSSGSALGRSLPAGIRACRVCESGAAVS